MGDFDLGRWAGRAGLRPFPGTPADLISLGDMEIDYYVAERAGRYVVERSSRGGPRDWLGRFPTEDAARGFLIAVIGRIQRPRRPAVPFDPDEPVPEGAVLRSGDADFPRSHTGLLHARLYQLIAGAPPEQVAASYDSADGRPLFGPPAG